MQHLVLRTASECEGFARSHVPLTLFAAGGAVTLDLPIDKATQARLQGEVDRLLATCGCVQSSLAMLAVLVPALVAIWVFGADLGLNRWVLSGGALAASVAAAFTVKHVVLSDARRRLRAAMLGVAAQVGRSPLVSAGG